ncbi:Rad4-domain-containing protein [Marasmius fiardii PR-910]|nr:Rad4-domain-containing protein [Marasmius fiardii PR-910]
MVPSMDDASVDIVLDDSEDDFDWEEVEVPQQPLRPVELELNLEQEEPPQPTKDIEIILKKASGEDTAKKKGISHAERVLRIGCHKVHTVSLLANASIRNRWLNDELLHARLLSLTPLPLQNSFAMIHPSRVPEQAMRGRMFEAAIGRLVDWWKSTFFEVLPHGHMRNRTYDNIQQKLLAYGYGIDSKKDGEQGGMIDNETLEDILDDDIELIRSEKSLMKHTLMQAGSRDTSAQLFTALCRGLGIPSRLIVSLQSVPWQTGIGKPKPKYQKKPKGKAKAIESDGNLSTVSTAGASSSRIGTPGTPLSGIDGTPVEKSEKAKGKEKAKPQIKLRKAKMKGRSFGGNPKPKRIDPLTSAPVFWTEVFSKPDSRWIPVDPLRGIVNKRNVFDPTAEGTNPENRMVYVIGFEEDGYARDVTRRYAKNYSTKVAKEQGGSSAAGAGGRGRQQWWTGVVQNYTRPFRLNRDDMEDEELDNAQLIEGMPTTIGGFKDHPLYVLLRHLKQNETIYPPLPETLELGRFRGEPVYSRDSVISLKTAENWLRSEGRSIKEGEQPLKFIKMRASTVNRQREIEMMKEGLPEAGTSASTELNGKDGGEIMQGLYARRQTERFVPDPVVDGKVPKNNFGNIDLYVPSMLPKGAVHIPFKGVAKIARKLGIDYAEAVTGFEFRKRRATPVIEGVVVAAENESVLLEAFWEAEQDAEEKAKFKREERVVKLWTKLVHGLRIRQRLIEQYADRNGRETSRNSPAVNEGVDELDTEPGIVASTEGGGFLVEAGDVVEAFHLPKYQRIDEDNQAIQLPPANNHLENSDVMNTERSRLDLVLETMDVDEGDDVRALSLMTTSSPTSKPVIKTMQELAEDAARALSVPDEDIVEEIPLNLPVSPTVVDTPPTNARERPKRTTSGRSTPSRSKRATSESRRTARNTRKSTKKRKRSDEDDVTSDGEEDVTPSKRPKAAAVVAPSTRVLRPRASKPKAQPVEGDEP